MQVYLIRHLPFNGSKIISAFSVATRLGLPSLEKVQGVSWPVAVLD